MFFPRWEPEELLVQLRGNGRYYLMYRAQGRFQEFEQLGSNSYSNLEDAKDAANEMLELRKKRYQANQVVKVFKL